MSDVWKLTVVMSANHVVAFGTREECETILSQWASKDLPESAVPKTGTLLLGPDCVVLVEEIVGMYCAPADRSSEMIANAQRRLVRHLEKQGGEGDEWREGGG